MERKALLHSTKLRDKKRHLSANYQNLLAESLRLAESASWGANVFICGTKFYIAITSSSWAILAVLVDSLVDIFMQSSFSIGEMFIVRRSQRYPIGRTRLEELNVIVSSFLMILTSIEVLQYSFLALVNGFIATKPQLRADFSVYLIMCLAIALKLLLWLLCRRLNAALEVIRSDTIEALGVDHFNDVLTNSAALFAFAVAAHSSAAWWTDPLGAVLIALLIAGRWMLMVNQQVKKLVGYTAPPEFIKQLEALAHAHDPRLQVDCIRAYHFGAKCK
jgi:divalent metal cation (Fe/Co/Zn/Cd) transporter